MSAEVPWNLNLLKWSTYSSCPAGPWQSDVFRIVALNPNVAKSWLLCGGSRSIRPPPVYKTQVWGTPHAGMKAPVVTPLDADPTLKSSVTSQVQGSRRITRRALTPMSDVLVPSPPRVCSLTTTVPPAIGMPTFVPLTFPLGTPSTTRLTTSDPAELLAAAADRKSTRLNSSHLVISYAVFCLKKKKKKQGNDI